MHTSGLVITFTEDPALAGAAEREMAAAGPFTLGDRNGPCQAATLEVADPNAAHDWHNWASGLPGVEGIEVVFVHWDDVEEGNHVGA